LRLFLFRGFIILIITNKNPLEYIKDFDKPAFVKILPTHLLGDDILTWSRSGNMPDNALELFIESRINNILSILKEKIKVPVFDIIDTIGSE
jgi:hypothetical protein